MGREVIKIKKPEKEFLKSYNLNSRYTLKPERSKGKPGIYEGSAPDGNPVLVKVWPRNKGVADKDLEDIWRNEVRHLHRLTGSLGAESNISEFYDSGYDSSGFYLVLNPGLRKPLPAILDSAPSSHWINNPRLLSNRILCWLNVKLLVQGLETLHSQGLLHRNLDKWAVLTSGSQEPDFQLTGFEWSMRVISAEQTAGLKRKINAQHSEFDSFLHDWKLLGTFVADLLGINPARLKNLSIQPSDVSDAISGEEIRCLRELCQYYPTHTLDGEVIHSRLEGILANLNAVMANIDPAYCLALRLGVGSGLSENIREASDSEIEIDDVDAQLDFIERDLSEDLILLSIRANHGGAPRYALAGKNLIYRIKEYSHPKSNSATWEYAFCEAVEKEPPLPANILVQKELAPSNIQCMSMARAFKEFPRNRGKSSSWELLLNQELETSNNAARHEIAHKALTLIQIIDSLHAATNVFPVSIEHGTSSENILVSIRKDATREGLSNLLKLKSPVERFKEALIGDGLKPDAWILTESSSLGDKNPTDTEWQFVQPVKSNNGRIKFLFSGTAHPLVAEELFLVPTDLSGSDKQFKRILKALKSLKDHSELLKMLVDPRGRVKDSQERVEEDDLFGDLDIPKQEAIKAITSTMPIYLVQGPPGVGKTRLVGELVRRRFLSDHTSRLLLSAQSNSAVDHLMDELESVLEKDNESKPLIVRSRSRDLDGKSTKYSSRVQALEIVKKLAKSPLASSFPEHLRLKIEMLLDQKLVAPTTDMMNLGELGRTKSQLIRDIEGLVVRSANVVFATTNSYELEKLIDERSQFDWSIIEEAGKATGSELVSPLLLSHRRLLIGDHKQLPAFSAEKFERLLESPEIVQQLLESTRELLGRAYRDATTDEILDDIENSVVEFPKLCSEAIRMLSFFETAIEKEFDRQNTKPKSRGIATKLVEQHRMHPAIASLVSNCFYNGALKTHVDCEKSYLNSKPPFDSLDSKLMPETPIVVVDMPYVQSDIGVKRAEQYPRWTNEKEVDALVRALDLLSARSDCSKQPTLAILSPYNQQRIKLNERISSIVDDNCMVRGFKSSVSSGEFCHTVDSFQGSEADVVLISLVRNNQHANISSALGFLRDERRMNVLLSRARWKLVLVTSTDFLKEVTNSVKNGAQSVEISFLYRFLSCIDDGISSGDVSMVPCNKLLESK